MAAITRLKVARLAASEEVSFGPRASYRPLLADGDTPVFLGIQTSEPGYETEPHSHPYVETLFVLEGEAEVWLLGGEDEAARLTAGDCAALPPHRPHAFRVPRHAPAQNPRHPRQSRAHRRFRRWLRHRRARLRGKLARGIDGAAVDGRLSLQAPSPAQRSRWRCWSPAKRSTKWLAPAAA